MNKTETTTTEREPSDLMDEDTLDGMLEQGGEPDATETRDGYDDAEPQTASVNKQESERIQTTSANPNAIDAAEAALLRAQANPTGRTITHDPVRNDFQQAGMERAVRVQQLREGFSPLMPNKNGFADTRRVIWAETGNPVSSNQNITLLARMKKLGYSEPQILNREGTIRAAQYGLSPEEKKEHPIRIGVKQYEQGSFVKSPCKDLAGRQIYENTPVNKKDATGKPIIGADGKPEKELKPLPVFNTNIVFFVHQTLEPRKTAAYCNNHRREQLQKGNPNTRPFSTPPKDMVLKCSSSEPVRAEAEYRYALEHNMRFAVSNKQYEEYKKNLEEKLTKLIPSTTQPGKFHYESLALVKHDGEVKSVIEKMNTNQIDLSKQIAPYEPAQQAAPTHKREKDSIGR